MNKIRTSRKVASKASSQLRSKVTTKKTKSVAGSALRNKIGRASCRERV